MSDISLEEAKAMLPGNPNPDPKCVAKKLFEEGVNISLIAKVIDRVPEEITAWAEEERWASAVSLEPVVEQPKRAPEPPDIPKSVLNSMKDVQKELNGGSLVLESLDELQEAADPEVSDYASDTLSRGLAAMRKLPKGQWAEEFKVLMASELMRLPFLLRSLTTKEVLKYSKNIKELSDLMVSLMSPKSKPSKTSGPVNVAIFQKHELPPEIKTIEQ